MLDRPCLRPSSPRRRWWTANSAGQNAAPRRERTRKRPPWHSGRGTRTPATSCRTRPAAFGHCRRGFRRSQCHHATRMRMSKVIVTSGVKPRSAFALACVWAAAIGPLYRPGPVQYTSTTFAPRVIALAALATADFEEVGEPQRAFRSSSSPRRAPPRRDGPSACDDPLSPLPHPQE